MDLVVSGLWLLASLLPLLLLERWIHRHLQGVWLLVFRDADMALVLYSLMMLPGVLLHEASHWLTATLLGVRAGRFSVMPARLPNGTLRLGYVETERVDPLREALIGAAPLIFGTVAIVFAGYQRLGVGPVGQALARGDLLGMVLGLEAMTRQPDFWLWLYFVFAVSNSMLPSASDRRAWVPVLAVSAMAAGLLVYVGLGAALLETLGGPLDAGLRALAAAFTITVGLDLVCVPLIWGIEQALVRLTGFKVEY